MNKNWVILTILVLCLSFGAGLFLTAKFGVGDDARKVAEKNCLTGIADENCKFYNNCAGVCVTKYVDAENKTYGCQIPCGHLWKDNIKFTEEEIQKCNMTKWLESG